MAKVNQIMPLYKISVDWYEEHESNRTFTAYCYTPGLKGEESYLERTITWDELKEQACDKYGEVRCTYLNDAQETEDIPFERWYDDNRHTDVMHDVMADIINKREGRKKLAPLPNMISALDNAMSKLDKVMHILNPAKTA